jgi:hypothetical protein
MMTYPRSTASKLAANSHIQWHRWSKSNPSTFSDVNDLEAIMQSTSSIFTDARKKSINQHPVISLIWNQSINIQWRHWFESNQSTSSNVIELKAINQRPVTSLTWQQSSYVQWRRSYEINLSSTSNDVTDLKAINQHPVTLLIWKQSVNFQWRHWSRSNQSTSSDVTDLEAISQLPVTSLI